MNKFMVKNQNIYAFSVYNFFLSLTVNSQIGHQLEIQVREHTLFRCTSTSLACLFIEWNKQIDYFGIWKKVI